MLSQFAAESAPNGAVHSRCGGSSPPLNKTEARPPPDCCAAVDSHTDRKTTTWLASPRATAMHASIAGPIWPAVSSDDMYQRLRRPNALRTSTTVAPENPG